MEESKPFINRVVACFCALGICCLVVFCGFSIPKIHAESVADQWEDYIDQTLFEGASSILEEVGQGVLGVTAPHLVPWAVGVNIGLNMMTSDRIGSSVPLNSITTCQGFYNYNNEKRLCNSTLANGNYVPADGGLTIAKSPDFEMRYNFALSPKPSFYSCGVINNSYGPEPYIQARWNQTSVYSGSVEFTGGGSIFSNDTTRTYQNIQASTLQLNCQYANNEIPSLNDGLSASGYFGLWGYSIYNRVAGVNHSVTPNWSNRMVWSDLSNLIGLDSNTMFDFTDEDSIINFVINTLNPLFIEIDPSLQPILFLPIVIPPETVSPSGCGCHVDVYVNVEPTINVYVDNNVELPSEWTQDYTTPSFPVETIPWPTQDASESPPVELPTIDSEDYQEEFGTAIEFWFYVAQTFITKMHLELIIAFAFALSVAGFILWRLGGGKDD